MTPWWAIAPFVRGILIVAALTILYGLLLRRLATAVHPSRLHLAERGEKYLTFCDDPKEKSQIRFYLDNAFNPWIAIACCALLWVALALVLFRSRRTPFTPKTKEEYSRLCGLFTLSAFAANPLFGAIVAFEIFIIAAVGVVLAGNIALIRRTLALMLETQAARTDQHYMP